MFRYQPELADTVIYWSLTGVFLFLSIIGLLEHQGAINFFSIATFVVFLAATFLGTRRKMILTDSQLKIMAILKKNSYLIDLSEVQIIFIGKMGITIEIDQVKYIYVMLPPSKKKFIQCIETQPDFTGKLLGVDTNK
ncbi:hypothetical protein CBF37_04220 [Vagococcus vulneris]|uniref:Pore-forming protein n=2 Tax=Vagococcus vulneris TaxID=1977869 RepID=A0A429ZZU1_9ENTE|nr:hypothetical protein CBF37_04220 [Vagococcus vulneris]